MHLLNVKIRMMKSKMKFLSAVFLTLVVATHINAQPQQSDRMITVTENSWQADQGDGYYMNPILKGDWGDPTVLRVGKDYYMTNHTATHSTPSMLIWHSRDLVNWEPLTYALTEDFGCLSYEEQLKYKQKQVNFIISIYRFRIVGLCT